jgi:ATP-binding cassette subfamily B protein
MIFRKTTTGQKDLKERRMVPKDRNFWLNARMSEFDQLRSRPLWFYIRQNRRSFTLGMGFLLVTNALDGFYPLILKRAIDEVAAKAGLDQIFQTALLFFAMMSILACTRFLWRFHFGRYHTHAAEDLRSRIFAHLSTMGPNFFKKNPVGELLSLMVNDIQSFRNGIGGGVLVFVDGIIIIIITLPMMIWLSPAWTWKTLVLLPTVPFLIRTITNKIYENFSTQQEQLAELSGISQEMVAGIRVIKGFAQEDNRIRMYNQRSKTYETACNRTAYWDSLFVPVMEFGVASGSVILLFVCAPDIFTGVASVGSLVAFQRYIQKMTWPMTALGMGYSQYQKGMASLDRIFSLLEQKTDIPETGTVPLTNFQSLQVKDLSYQFADANSLVLDKVSFDLKAGEFIGIIGPVGSGKTTLLHLLARLYPAPSGSILINGVPIEQILSAQLRQTVSLVPQEAFLFSETIANNMGYGLEQTPAVHELKTWASSVDMDQEIESLPGSYESELGERGVNLSGGQKQRLTIARSLITKAPLLMLDDSLSAVDTGTESLIKSAIKKLTGRSLIVVAHRISSIENADRILVLNQGRVEALGKHADLLKTSVTYQAMARTQGYETSGSENSL